MIRAVLPILLLAAALAVATASPTWQAMSPFGVVHVNNPYDKSSLTPASSMDQFEQRVINIYQQCRTLPQAVCYDIAKIGYLGVDCNYPCKPGCSAGGCPGGMSCEYVPPEVLTACSRGMM